jgi:hypothetical protein
MPNWCINRLQIIGRRDEIDQCLESIKGEDSAFDFKTVIPGPEKYARLGNRAYHGFNSEGYWWCCEHWGTKWNAQPRSGDTMVAERIPTGTEICFDTAWSPPTPVLLKLSKKFPELEFRLYFVVEMVGQGLARFKNGETLFFESVEDIEDEFPERDWEELLDRANSNMKRSAHELISEPQPTNTLVRVFRDNNDFTPAVDNDEIPF